MNYLISLRKVDPSPRRQVDRYFIYFGEWYRVHKSREHVTVFIQLTADEKEVGIRIGNEHSRANWDYDDVTGEAIYHGMGDFLDSFRDP